jgi:DNA helicase-2/ATP-dependent DNA helicase PcrA
LTRAKKRLWITYANTRYRFGSLVQNEPSRFIDELPEQFVDKSYSGGGAKNQGSDYGNGTAFERMRGWGRGEETRSAGGQEYGSRQIKRTHLLI